MKQRWLGDKLKLKVELFALSIALASAGILFMLLSADIAVACLGIGGGAAINLYIHYF